MAQQPELESPFLSGPLHVVSLEVENVKRINALTIRPDGDVIIIGGDNDQGKSSTLDCIQFAMGGGWEICDEPLRRGARRGSIKLDLGEIVVTRTFTKKGGELIVKRKGKSRKEDSPQTLLDDLIGALSFDPLRFSMMDKQERIDTLKKLAGLDFTELDERRAEAYVERKDITREVRIHRSNLDKLERYPDAPEEEVNIADLFTELEERQAHNREVENTARRRKEIADRITAIEEELETLTAELEQITAEDAQLAERPGASEKIDEEEIRSQIASAQEINDQVRANQAYQKQQEQLDDSEAILAEIQAEMEEIDEVKALSLAEAEYPVETLSVTNTDVFIEGIPWDQLSDSVRLRASVAIGIATNPKLRVLLIRKGALLDSKNLELVAEMAREHSMQVWIERVGHGDECSLIIQDGRVLTEDERAELTE